MVGEAEIECVLVGKPTEIWKKTKCGSGIPASFFKEYYKNREVAVAYKLSNVKTYETPKALWRHTCATVFYLPETAKRLTIITFSISKASLTKNPIPNTGRTISGKDSDEVIQQFGASLT